MATTVARLEAVLSADTSKFDSAMGHTESRMQKAGRVAGRAGLAIAGGLVAGGVVAVKAASDLGEQMNKTGVVFGDNAKDVQQWSKGLARNFGLSQRAALEAAGTFGNMVVPMGISRKEAAKMSKTMVQLGGDMASFNNASPEETLNALRAGLAGETEPLRRFGVFLNEARIQAEAMSLGLVKAEVDTAKLGVAQVATRQAVRDAAEALREHGKGSIEYAGAVAGVEYQEAKVARLLEGKVPKLTAAQKAQASYSLITKDTADAQGDFAETSDSLANQQRILRAEIENLAAKLGTALLPAVQKVAQAMSALIQFSAEHTTATKVLAGALGVLAGALLAARLAQLAMNLAVLANPYVAVTVAVIALGAAMVILWQRVEEARKFIIALGIAMAPLPVAFAAAWRASETFRDIVKGALNAVATAGEAVADIFRWFRDHVPGIFKGVENAIDGPLGAMRTALRGVANAAEAIKDVFVWIINNAGRVKDAIKSAIPKIPDLTPGFTPGWPFGDPDDATRVRPPSAGAAGAVFANSTIDQSLWDELGLSRRFGLALTSGYRPGAITRSGTPSDHGTFPSKAIDVAGSAASMAAFFMALIGNRGVKQAFYDPLGSIFGGMRSGYREGGHSDHVHVATYDKGGWLPPGLTLALNKTGVSERVISPGAERPIVINLGGLIDKADAGRWIQSVIRGAGRDGIIIDQPQPGFG